MREILVRLNSLLSLTKQERTVVIFLAVSLIVGNSILFIKRRRQDFAKDLITSEQFTLDQLIGKSDSLVKAGKEYFKIDINNATLEELELLPGVGQTTARKIIEYRDKFGPFKTPEELMKVKGIGKAKYGGLKDCIVVSPEGKGP